jgi:hypothetical protein
MSFSDREYIPDGAVREPRITFADALEEKERSWAVGVKARDAHPGPTGPEDKPTGLPNAM